MAAYRIYYGDRSGHMFSADDLEAPSDEAAIANAMVKGRALTFEIWQDDRLVHKHGGGIRGRGGKPLELAQVVPERKT